MSVSNVTDKALYSGDGVTVDFVIPFDIIDNDSNETEVYLIDTTTSPYTETLQTEVTHYTLTGATPPGFDTTVSFVAAPSSTKQVLIRRKIPLTQPLALNINAEYPAESSELAYDRLAAEIQQLREIVSRGAYLRKSTSLVDALELYDPVADKYLRWDSTARKIIYAYPDASEVTFDNLLHLGMFTSTDVESALYELAYDIVALTSSNSAADKVRVTVNDTDAGYLDDKIQSGSNRITASVYTPGSNEKLRLTLNESNIVHQNLSGAGTNTHTLIDAHIADGTIHNNFTDHGLLTVVSLADDDHAQYLLLAGRATGQTAYGGTAAGENLGFGSTSHATKGLIKLGPNNNLVVDETNNFIGIGTVAPSYSLEVVGNAGVSTNFGVGIAPSLQYAINAYSVPSITDGACIYAETVAGNSLFDRLSGVYAVATATHTGKNVQSLIYGGRFEAENAATGSGAVTSLIGVGSETNHNATFSTTQMIGYYTRGTTSTGSLNAYYGIMVDSGSFTATMNEFYGLAIYTPSIGAGTLSASYGIYLGDVSGFSGSGVDDYSIYSEGGRMYHAGSVGIGTTPTSKLDILPTGTFAAAGVSAITAQAHTVTLSGANPTTYATFYANEIGAMTLVGTNLNQTVTAAAGMVIAPPIKSTNVALTNTYGLLIPATAVSTATSAWGMHVSPPTGATNNYAAQFNGKVGINNVGLGSNCLDVYSATSGTVMTVQTNGILNGQTIFSLTQGGSTVAGNVTAFHGTISCTGSGAMLIQQAGAGNAVLHALVTGAGDPHAIFAINGGQTYAVGLDNSDSDKFKISGSSALGTTDLVTIDTTGKLGIGTASPNEALDVTGNIRFSGVVKFGADTVLNFEASDNTFVGKNAGAVVVGGTQNTLVGYNAGAALAGALYYNTMVGAGAGAANTTGLYNVMVGWQAGGTGTTGDNNVFLGAQAGRDNTANNNIFVGYLAGAANTSGTRNIVFGIDAGSTNTTSSDIIAIGYQAGKLNTGANNVFIGRDAGTANTTGATSVIIGYQAAVSNQTSVVTAIGSQAGFSSTGANNTFIGQYAGALTSSGTDNTIIGYDCGYFNTTNSQQTFLGSGAGRSITGAGNSMVGYRAGYGGTTGAYNTFIGNVAGSVNTTGGSNTAIGYTADFGANNLSRATAIGFGAVAGASDCVVLGRISDAQVGIGTTTPLRKLHVAGDTPYIRLQNTAVGGQTMEFFAGTAGIGIGTPATASQVQVEAAAPTLALIIGASRTTFGTTGGIQAIGGSNLLIKSDSSGTAGVSVKLQGFNAASDWETVFSAPNKASGNIDAILVENGGKVGIGITTPTSKLHVVGNDDVVQYRLVGHSTQTNNILLIENSAGTDLAWVTNAGNLTTAGIITANSSLYGGTNAFKVDGVANYHTTLWNAGKLLWSSTGSCDGSPDVGFSRISAGLIGLNDGSTGNGELQITKSKVTAGTMTAASNAFSRKVISKFTWTNAQVVALGAALTGDITVCTLPAKTIVTNAYIVIDSAAGGPVTLTVALGRTGAAYSDYIVASDARAAANTVYGDASGERGSNLTGYDLPSYTGTTDVKAHFISTVSNLDQVTTCTGTVFVETMTVP